MFDKEEMNGGNLNDVSLWNLDNDADILESKRMREQTEKRYLKDLLREEETEIENQREK